jgi:hypothetical protein
MEATTATDESKPTNDALEKEMIEKGINTPELLKAIHMWAFRCPRCHKVAFKMTDIRTDTNERHGYLSNNRCFSCDCVLDYDRDICGDSHDYENDEYPIGWAVEGRTNKGHLRVQSYYKTRCVFCGEEHYLPMKSNRIQYTQCVCQTGKPITQTPKADAPAPRQVPELVTMIAEEKPITIEGKYLSARENLETMKNSHGEDVPLVECEICHNKYMDGKGIRNHKRFKHNIPPRGPLVIKKNLPKNSPYRANMPEAPMPEAPKVEEAKTLPQALASFGEAVGSLAPAIAPAEVKSMPAFPVSRSKLGVNPLTIHVPDDVMNALKEYSFDKELTKSKIVIDALRAFLGMKQ